MKLVLQIGLGRFLQDLDDLLADPDERRDLYGMILRAARPAEAAA